MYRRFHAAAAGRETRRRRRRLLYHWHTCLSITKCDNFNLTYFELGHANHLPAVFNRPYIISLY